MSTWWYRDKQERNILRYTTEGFLNLVQSSANEILDQMCVGDLFEDTERAERTMNRLWFGFPPPSTETKYKILRKNNSDVEVFCKFSIEQRIIGQERLLRITFTYEPSENLDESLELDSQREITYHSPKNLSDFKAPSPMSLLNSTEEPRTTNYLSVTPPTSQQGPINTLSSYCFKSTFEKMAPERTQTQLSESESVSDRQDGVQPSQRERISILSLLN